MKPTPDLVPTTVASPEPNHHFPSGFDEDEIINVDTFEYEDAIRQSNKLVTKP